MLKMDGLSSKLSIYDFFNAIFTGIIFILCFNFSIHDIIHIVNDYFSEENFGQAAPIYMGVAFVLTCYIIGILIQGLFELIYNRLPCGHRKSIRRIFEGESVTRIFWFEKVKHKNIVDNEAKYIIYENKAKNLFREKDLYKYWKPESNNDKDRDNDKDNEKDSEKNNEIVPPTREELSQYFFAYCIYYLQAKGKNQKTERMRDVAAIAGMLSTLFFNSFCYKYYKISNIFI